MIRALKDTDIVFLPEMFTTGFMASDTSQAEPMEGPSVGWMRRIAAETGMALAGSLVIGDGTGRPSNRFLFAFPEGRLVWYDKRHLFSFSGEERFYAPGTERVVIEYKGFRILPMVCYDLRFPVWSRNRNDYDVAVYTASWPKTRMPCCGRGRSRTSAMCSASIVWEATRRPVMTGTPSVWIFSAIPLLRCRKGRRA